MLTIFSPKNPLISYGSFRYHSSERPAKRLRCENPKYQTLPPKSKHRRQHSDEKPSSSRSFKRPKTSEFRLESSLQERASSLSGSYFTLPHHRKSQKVTKASSFNVPSVVPAAPPSVKRENSLTSKLQDQSMGIHKLIFDRLNNNGHEEDQVKCECSSGLSKAGKSRLRCLALEEQRKLVKFRRFLRAAHICTKSDFLSAIEAIRRRQKREARRSIVDEHGIPPLYTQSR